MTELLTAHQMRGVEQRAIGAGEVTGLALMERAGQGVVDAILAHWPERRGAPGYAIVLCGPGNNGGDGFVIARLLDALGWRVDVHFYGDATKLPPDAAANYARWQAEHPVWALTQAGLRTRQRIGEVTHYIDALFGIGISRPLSRELGDIVGYLAGSGGDHGYFQPRMVAVDVPSGLDADSGRVLGCPEPVPSNSRAAYAALTVTFDSPKAGHFLADGPALCGKLVVCDIGLEAYRSLNEGNAVRPVSLSLQPPLGAVEDRRNSTAVDSSGLLSKQPYGHKYDHGAALVLSGGVGRGGAARLAARGALRMGAGLVTVGCPPSALMENAVHLDAIMLRKVADHAALRAMLADDSRLNALCIGPGLGMGAREAELVRTVLEARRACVLDADALTLIAQDSALKELLHERCVLTPHGGEFARLFPDIAENLVGPKRPELHEADALAERLKENPSFMQERLASLQSYRNELENQTGPLYSKVDAVRDAAAEAGCTVLLKGADTVIAEPNGRAVLCAAHYDRAAPWLATAGAGDVLAGFITGLLARRLDTLTAAKLGAWLHQECALSFGPGLIAEDLPEELPKVFRQLGI